MARSRRSAPAAPARKPATSSAPAPAKAKPAAPAPAVQSAPSSGGGMMGGLMGTMAEGLAWGTGTAIARRGVDAAINAFSGDSSDAQPAAVAAAPAPVAAAPSSQANVCFNDQKAFLDCLNMNKNDISSCQFYLDAFNECKQQSAYL